VNLKLLPWNSLKFGKSLNTSFNPHIKIVDSFVDELQMKMDLFIIGHYIGSIKKEYI